MGFLPDAEDSPDLTVQSFFYVIMAVEMIETLLNFYIFYAYSRIIVGKATLHANLRFLLILLPSCHMVFLGARFLANAFAIFNMETQRNDVQRVADLAGSMFYGFSVILASERLLAAYYGMRYEETAISLTIPITCSILMGVFITYVCLMTFSGVLDAPYIYSVLGSCVVYSTVVAFLLPHIAQRQHKSAFLKRFSGSQTLAGRILIEENMKTAHALRIVLPFIGISSILLLMTFILFWSIFRSTFPEWFLVYGKLVMAFYYCLNASQTLIFMLLLLFYHKSLKAKLALSFPILLKISREWARIHAESKLIAAKGIKMSAEQQKELYFATYRQLWN